jgi:hypothetical protein
MQSPSTICQGGLPRPRLTSASIAEAAIREEFPDVDISWKTTAIPTEIAIRIGELSTSKT